MKPLLIGELDASEPSQDRQKNVSIETEPKTTQHRIDEENRFVLNVKYCFDTSVSWIWIL